MLKRPLRLAAALTAVALVAAACGSSSSTPSTTTTKLTKSPVVIGQIVPLTGQGLQLTQSGQAMKAAIKYYNAHGGLNGHPLVLDQCDTQYIASLEAQCAQKLVNDHAVADIGGDTNTNVTAVQSTLDAAGIPRIGMLMGSITEYQSMNDYAIEPGMILMLGGMEVELIKHGAKKVSMVTVDTPQAAQLKALLAPIAVAAGGELVNVVLIPGTATDYTQYLTAAEANGATGAALAVGTAQANAFVQVYNQLKPTLKMSASSGTYSSDDLKKLGPWAHQAYYTYGVPIGNDPKVPGLKNVSTVLTEGGSGLTPASTEGQAIIPVMAMRGFMEAAGTITGDITGKSVQAAMNAATNLNMWGITPPWTPSKYISAGTTFGSIFANVSNPFLYDEGWNGTNGTDNGTFNMLKYVPGATVS